MNQDFDASANAGATAATQAQEKPKTPFIAHIMCGWPLVLVLMGGAIGGGLGGAAYAVNMGIYKSGMPVPAKVLLNIITGLAAFGLWFSLALWLNMATGR